MSEVVLSTEGLTKYYGSLAAVRNLTLSVFRGEVFGLLGPNGAGKTTSIKMICGLLRPNAGRVFVQGQPITGGGPDLRARVGVCPQEIVLWSHLTCLEQLQFVAELYNIPFRAARQRADRLLDDLGLSEKRNKQARTLSGGMQRRLNLAMALVHDPEIVVLDEPEAGLDPQSRVAVRAYIKRLAKDKTVILTTHNMDEADRLADRVAIIDYGELLVLDTPQALKRRVGEGDVLEITLKTDFKGEANIQDALDDLAPRIDMEITGDGLHLRALNIANLLPAILERFEQIDLPVAEVRLRENTLEDVFIQLTGRRLRE
jgi:ABC-2 type transport system ATP-binding protein